MEVLIFIAVIIVLFIVITKGQEKEKEQFVRDVLAIIDAEKKIEKQKNGGTLILFDDDNIVECPEETGETLEVNLETGETILKNKSD